MAKLYVPIIVNKQLETSQCNLFSVVSHKHDITNYYDSDFNALPYSYLDRILKCCFPTETFSFDVYEYNKDPEVGVFENFSQNTASISLGVFCSAYAEINDRKYKDDYDSITLTGDLQIYDKKIQLSEVILIKEKFEAVANYANNHADKKHLFLYISSEEIVPEGLHENNLLVVRYDTTFPLECIFSEIFESINDNQQSYYKNKNDYIQTKTFLRLKKDFVKQQGCKGLIIKGESNTGKSIAANALCKYLQDCNQIDDYVWLTITDNRKFYKLLREDISNIKLFDFQNNENLVKQKYSKQFDKFDDLLKQGKKCLFIIDNIESNYVDQVLDFFKRYYSAYTENFKLIITSWEGCNYRESKNFLNVKEIDITEIALDKNEFEGVVNSLIASVDYKYKYQEASPELQNELIEILYNQCSKYPGYVPIALALLNTMSVNQIVEYFSSKDVKKMQPVTRLFQIAFMQMDIFSQMVLFAYLQLKNIDENIFEDKAIFMLTNQIFNKKAFVDKHNIQQGIQIIKQHRFIEDVSVNKFIIKRDVINYCVFSKEITKELELLRNTLITDESKVEFAIENNLYEEFEKYINRITEKEKLNEFLIRLCEYDSELPFFELLLKKCADVNYVDKDGDKPLDVYCCCGNAVEIVRLLIDKGATASKDMRKGVNFFVLALNKSNPEIVEYLLSKKLFDSFEEYYLGRFTVLQLYALIGTNTVIFDSLVKYGAKVDAKTKDGWTLLQCAVLNQNTLILEHIIYKGYVKNIDEKSEQDATALQMLCGVGNNCKNLQILIEHGANTNIVYSGGKTLLHLAVANENIEPLEYLLDNNHYSDLLAKNAGGQTALELAAELGNLKAENILQKAMNK